MRQVVIENPVINSPFHEPGRHFKFTDEGITDEVIDGRRTSSYFVPIAQPRKKGQKQLVFDTEWTQDRIEENKLVNQIRARVRLWREGGYIGVKSIYDLSATPFFLRGSGYPEGTLFAWVVSDFSLIDAVEAGIVKVPRVPVSDDSMTGEQPTYRDLWLRIREDLPRKGRKTEAVGGEPSLPAELQGALHSLYGNYEKYYRLWEKTGEAKGVCVRFFSGALLLLCLQ